MVLDYFNKPKTYYSGFESFCYQNCLRLLLEGSDISYASLYLNASLSLIIKYDEVENKLNFMQHENIRSLIPDYLNRVEKHYYKSNADAEKIFLENIRLIRNKNIPIITGVDVFYLPYTPYYHKNHGTHTLLLCGYEEPQKWVYVVDWYEPWFYNGIIDKTEFLLARNSVSPYDGSIYSGEPILNNWAEVDIDGFNSDPTDLLKENIKLCLKQYFDEDKDLIVGIQALKILKNYLSCNDNTQEMYIELHKQLYIFLKRYKFFKQYLDIYGKHRPDKAIFELSFMMSNTIKIWDYLLMLVLKLSVVESKITKHKIIINLGLIIDNEINFRERLLKFLS